MKNNIPVFPRHYEITYREMVEGKVIKLLRSEEGMTLRDYFAGQALIGLIQQTSWESRGILESEISPELVRTLDHLGFCSYRLSDAMLAERKKDVK